MKDCAAAIFCFCQVVREVGPQTPGQGGAEGERVEDGPGDAVEGFLCPTCYMSFPKPELLQDHYEAEHIEPSANYLCPVCKARLNSQQELEKHYSTIHGVKGKVWFCCEWSCMRISEDTHYQDIISLKGNVLGYIANLRNIRFNLEKKFTHDLLVY